jgi:hypothetical protein
MSDREKRMLLLLIPLVLIVIIRYAFFSGGGATASTAVVSVNSAPLVEKRLAKMRQVAATVPGKQAVLNQVDSELAAREKGIISADTAAQAQAHLLEVARRDAKAENIDVRGGELGPVKNFSTDYGEASVTVSFECHIHEFVNFMAAISHEPELIAPQDLRINSSNPKEKTILVRMTLSGLVPKKLVPEKKGFSTF